MKEGNFIALRSDTNKVLINVDHVAAVAVQDTVIAFLLVNGTTVRWGYPSAGECLAAAAPLHKFLSVNLTLNSGGKET